MEIKTIQKFVANDGTEFTTKAEAIAHNLAGPRIAAVEKAYSEGKFVVGKVSEDDRGNAIVFVDDLPTFLAANADLLLTLLAKPVTPRAKKEPAAPKA